MARAERGAAREGGLGSLRYPATRFLLVAGVTVLLGLALWLRWRYVQGVSLYVDEYTTLWASQRTLETGAPIMPSGVLYTRGILHSYVIAGFAAIGGLTYTVGRLPSVVFGLAAILAIFFIGHREWNTRAAWLATVGLVFLPEAIEASSRARFYAPLVFFVLLTIWAAYVATQRGRASRRAHLLFAGSFVLALFSHEQTLLLYPSIVLGVFLWRGWRSFLRPPVLTAQLICVAALALRYAVEQLGQPDQFAAIQSSKPFISLLSDVSGAWREYGSLFISPRRLLWTVFALLAIGVAVVDLRRARWRLLQLPRLHQATLFFALQFVAVFLIMLLAVKWREDRYIWMVQPAWLLVGAAGAVWAVDRITVRPGWRWAATGGLSLLMLLLLAPLSLSALALQPEGYDPAFNYIVAQRQPGDVVMSPQPPACAVVLGEPCDYYARERGYEPYVIPQSGALVDRWTGARLLNSADQLEELLRNAPRVWFVIDGHRLAERYRDEFIRTVVEQFDPVLEERGVRVLLAQGWREPPAYTVKRSLDPPAPLGALALTGWERSESVPGEPLHMLLFWELTGFIPQQINTSVQLVAADGSRLAQADGPPTRGMISTYDRTEAMLPDPKSLLVPRDLASGRYRLEVIAYDTVTHTPLAYPLALDWFRVGPLPPVPDQALNVLWQDGPTLVGHAALPAALSPGEPLMLRLVWTTATPLAANYTVFVHLIGPDGQIVAQSDRAPEDGFYPTSSWALHDRVEDVHMLPLPTELPAGEYRLVVGWYRVETGARVLLKDGADAQQLKQWTVR